MTDEGYFPPSEEDGGWRIEDLRSLGGDVDKLNDAIAYHDNARFTKSHGGALIIVYKGHIIGETYMTGTEGGPQPWTPRSCNDVKSSTKSVFGTAVGVFLDEYRNSVTLDTLLVGESREKSLIPQIWDQPITDERKKRIRVKHAISMTSGHESDEGAFQMYEYCFGWWGFKGVPAHHTLLFEPGHRFNYSNFGLEQMALAMRNVSGEKVGPYVYDRVLGPIGMPAGLRDNGYREMPYNDPRELNFSDDPGWGLGGSEGCNAYGADRSVSPYGHNTIVGSTFRCTARDFARLGYLWLRKGRWRSGQLVPEEWMKRATSRFIQENKETHNYGFTFWIHDEWENVPKDTFGSRGHNMNDCYVVPSLDLVVARQGNDNPPREKRSLFVKDVLEKIVQAIVPAA
jgi:CubicO group peptidase (beta-lactamase class C family)